jgi:hemoglobin
VVVVAETSLFERVGGQPFFDELVERFYEGVVADEVLSAMYPPDLAESKSHLALFLAQYWGGPTTYSELRGHPRLRMRHAPFRITKRARDAWLAHMRAAIAAVGDALSEPDRRELDTYFEMAAHQLRNV